MAYFLGSRGKVASSNGMQTRRHLMANKHRVPGDHTTPPGRRSSAERNEIFQCYGGEAPRPIVWRQWLPAGPHCGLAAWSTFDIHRASVCLILQADR